MSVRRMTCVATSMVVLVVMLCPQAWAQAGFALMDPSPVPAPGASAPSQAETQGSPDNNPTVSADMLQVPDVPTVFPAPADPDELFQAPVPGSESLDAEIPGPAGDLSSDRMIMAPEQGERQSLTEAEDGSDRLDFLVLSAEPYRNYRSTETNWSFVPGGGDDLGWFSYHSSPYLHRGSTGGLTTAFGIQWLQGPNTVPLPPRLYDFALGVQKRDTVSDVFSYDVATSIGVYSDFEDSARDGVRYISHAVGMIHINQATDVIFGVDYLDRDDIPLLPVVGLSWHDPAFASLRLDLVFPRPRIDYALTSDSRLYLAGTLGGGSWDIEFPDETNNVATIRDYRLVLGLEHADQDGSLSAWEAGYVSGRQLELRNGLPSVPFDDAFIVQFVWRH